MSGSTYLAIFEHELPSQTC